MLQTSLARKGTPKGYEERGAGLARFGLALLFPTCAGRLTSANWLADSGYGRYLVNWAKMNSGIRFG